MSNRTQAEVTYAAELKAAHLAQIEALTAPGLTDDERTKRFMTAARFNDAQRISVLDERALRKNCGCAHCRNYPVASTVWAIADAPYSLFANLPGCECPVIEVRWGRANFEGIPARIEFDWSPTAEELQAFARVQQERRL